MHIYISHASKHIQACTCNILSPGYSDKYISREMHTERVQSIYFKNYTVSLNDFLFILMSLHFTTLRESLKTLPCFLSSKYFSNTMWSLCSCSSFQCHPHWSPGLNGPEHSSRVCLCMRLKCFYLTVNCTIWEFSLFT